MLPKTGDGGHQAAVLGEQPFGIAARRPKPRQHKHGTLRCPSAAFLTARSVAFSAMDAECVVCEAHRIQLRELVVGDPVEPHVRFPLLCGFSINWTRASETSKMIGSPRYKDRAVSSPAPFKRYMESSVFASSGP